MVPAVELSEETKSRLEELQAAVESRTGETVTQQEILTQLVTDAFESKSEFVSSFEETTVPLSADEIERFNARTFSSEVETTEEDIDEILYGSEHNP